MVDMHIYKEFPKWVQEKLEAEKKEARRTCRKDGSDGPCNIKQQKERVTLQPAKDQPQQSLINDEVLKSAPIAGIQLLEIAKNLKEKEGLTLTQAIEKACRANPSLYEEYTNAVRR